MAGRAATISPYDIAIVDMELPGMDGAALIGELRRVIPEVRVLVVSGYGDRAHVKNLKRVICELEEIANPAHIFLR